jgi:hypothetical protein
MKNAFYGSANFLFARPSCRNLRCELSGERGKSCTINLIIKKGGEINYGLERVITL